MRMRELRISSPDSAQATWRRFGVHHRDEFWGRPHWLRMQLDFPNKANRGGVRGKGRPELKCILACIINLPVV